MKRMNTTKMMKMMDMMNLMSYMRSAGKMRFVLKKMSYNYLKRMNC